MGYFYGSIRHTTSGRKRKQPQRGRRKPYTPSGELEARSVYRRETKEYPSADIKMPANATAKPDSYRREISSQYTIAPAYNKGAYQVISRDNVKDIGK
jgi:hypothetical protein